MTVKPRIQKTPDGEWHIWPNGQRFFVRKTTPAPQAGTTQAPAQPAASAPLGEDSESLAARGQALANRTNQINDLTSAGQLDRADMEEALRRLRGQRPKDEQNTREGANRQGLFYSGQLGKRLDDLATDYARREADQQEDFRRRDAARTAARQAIEAGAPLDEAAISAARADRAVTADADAAQAGVLAPNQPATPKPPKRIANTAASYGPPSAPSAPSAPRYGRPVRPRARRVGWRPAVR